jgi:hypothetical protein
MNFFKRILSPKDAGAALKTLSAEKLAQIANETEFSIKLENGKELKYDAEKGKYLLNGTKVPKGVYRTTFEEVVIVDEDGDVQLVPTETVLPEGESIEKKVLTFKIGDAELLLTEIGEPVYVKAVVDGEEKIELAPVGEHVTDDGTKVVVDSNHNLESLDLPEGNLVPETVTEEVELQAAFRAKFSIPSYAILSESQKLAYKSFKKKEQEARKELKLESKAPTIQTNLSAPTMKVNHKRTIYNKPNEEDIYKLAYYAENRFKNGFSIKHESPTLKKFGFDPSGAFPGISYGMMDIITPTIVETGIFNSRSGLVREIEFWGSEYKQPYISIDGACPSPYSCIQIPRGVIKIDDLKTTICRYHQRIEFCNNDLFGTFAQALLANPSITNVSNMEQTLMEVVTWLMNKDFQKYHEQIMLYGGTNCSLESIEPFDNGCNGFFQAADEAGVSNLSLGAPTAATIAGQLNAMLQTSPDLFKVYVSSKANGSIVNSQSVDSLRIVLGMGAAAVYEEFFYSPTNNPNFNQSGNGGPFNFRGIPILIDAEFPSNGMMIAATENQNSYNGGAPILAIYDSSFEQIEVEKAYAFTDKYSIVRRAGRGVQVQYPTLIVLNNV